MSTEPVSCDVCRERGARRPFTSLRKCVRCGRTACEPTHWNKASELCYFCAKVR
ncbi:MAG: hypothetical protein KatS3mg061_3235 [Dehalococcoidia bacterium]|nr:MAG: hypothetical protein KatS3mg061_3235 [Dehalococcoidia bacterium]